MEALPPQLLSMEVLPPCPLLEQANMLSGPLSIEESRETSELSCDSLNLTRFISDPT